MCDGLRLGLRGTQKYKQEHTGRRRGSMLLAYSTIHKTRGLGHKTHHSRVDTGVLSEQLAGKQLVLLVEGWSQNAWRGGPMGMIQ